MSRQPAHQDKQSSTLEWLMANDPNARIIVQQAKDAGYPNQRILAELTRKYGVRAATPTGPLVKGGRLYLPAGMSPGVSSRDGELTPEDAEKYLAKLFGPDSPMFKQDKQQQPVMIRSNDALSNWPAGKPVKVKHPDGKIVHYPTAEHARAELMPRDALGGVEGQAEIRPRTAADGLRGASEHVGRMIAGLLGIDYDQMAAMQDHGISLAMLPLAPKGISKKMVDEGIGKLVAPEDVKPRRGMFHSFFNDEGGNHIDLGDNTHDVALAQAGEDFNKEANEGLFGMSDSLAKNKLMRVQVSPGDISIENHHPPTPHQIDALSKLVEKNSRAKFSYDISSGEANEFKNGVSGKNLMDKLIEFYYSGKTVRDTLREHLDNQMQRELTGKMKFGEPGEWVP